MAADTLVHCHSHSQSRGELLLLSFHYFFLRAKTEETRNVHTESARTGLPEYVERKREREK